MISALSNQLVQQCLSVEKLFRSRNSPPDVLNKVFRFGAPIGHCIKYHESADRCMDLARQYINECEKNGKSFNSGTTIFAEQLSNGMGRFQRQWYAPKGGIWMVLALVNTLLPKYARLLSLAAGVACCETVRHYGVPAKIKWVNDVHVEGRKIAGILTESLIGPESGEEYILIGIGINVNNKGFPENLSNIASSMTTILEKELDLATVAGSLLAKLSWNIGLLHYQEQNQLVIKGVSDVDKAPNLLLESWRSMEDTIGRQVTYGFNVVDSPLYSARVIDIDDSGALVLKLSDGTMVTESAGEVSYL